MARAAAGGADAVSDEADSPNCSPLRLGCPSYMQSWPAVARFIDRLRDGEEPRRVEVLDGLGSALLDGVRSRELDLAIVLGPVGDPTLTSIRIAEEPLLIALSDRHPLAALAEIPLHRLEGESLILFPRSVNPALYDCYTSLLADRGLRPTIVPEPSSEGSRTAAAADLGFALTPASLADEAPIPGLVHRLTAGPILLVDVNVVERPER